MNCSLPKARSQNPAPAPTHANQLRRRCCGWNDGSNRLGALDSRTGRIEPLRDSWTMLAVILARPTFGGPR